MSQSAEKQGKERENLGDQSLSALPIDVARFAVLMCRKSCEHAGRASEVLDLWRGDQFADALRLRVEAVARRGLALTEDEIDAGFAKAVVAKLHGIKAADLILPPSDPLVVDEAITQRRTATFPTSARLADEGYDEIDAMYDGNSGVRPSPKFFDRRTGLWLPAWGSPAGIESGRLVANLAILVGAASNAGKTTLGDDLLLSAAEEGIPAFAGQAELSFRATAAAMIARLAGIRRGARRTPEIRAKLAATRAAFDQFVSFPQVTAKDTLEDPEVMKAEIHRWLKRIGPPKNGNRCPGIIVVDYLQCLRQPGREQFDVVDQAAKNLAIIAHETGCITVCLSQMTRGSQVAFQAAIAKAAGGNNAWRQAEDLKDALEGFSEQGTAGGDVRRRADLAIGIGIIDGIGSVPDQRVWVRGKDRGHAWPTPKEASDNVALLVDLDDHGRWAATLDAEGQPKTLAQFSAELRAEMAAHGALDENTGGRGNKAQREAEVQRRIDAAVKTDRLAAAQATGQPADTGTDGGTAAEVREVAGEVVPLGPTPTRRKGW